MFAYYQKLFTYDRWANEQFLDTMLRETPPLKALQLLAHIIAAEVLWQSRLMGRPTPVPVWPAWTVDDCGQQLKALPQLWSEFWASGSNLQQSIRYTNSKGEEWTSRIDHVIDHVLFHSTYHRGQIAAELRKAGCNVPYTDYIHATRQKLIEEP